MTISTKLREKGHIWPNIYGMIIRKPNVKNWKKAFVRLF